MTDRRKQNRLAGELQCFVQRYGRKTQKQGDPSDRRYDKKIEKAMQRMQPADLSELLTGDNDDERHGRD
ncbi:MULTISPECIES: hypothetical protein [unclassified Caballeronia]|uniref:hypothetical protein n=1 Tax=unclassified Caballeronia TaxID=2646786 RepID=UPI0028560F5C|nr:MULTISPECIES: hypothetical protein [unclassified Caballeronia]MDR5749787.1 hypothetical protein [Caballeronia sp. LZ024]MDR5843085.1 hypothetical protein [Caballeronia sp. LZ031]